MWDGGEYMFVPHGDGWLVRFRGGQVYPANKNPRGLRHLHTLLQHPGDFISSDALTAIAEGRPIAKDALQISQDADQEAIDSVKKVAEGLMEELEEAKELCHDDEVARIEMELEQLGKYLSQETRRGGKAGREPKAVKQSRDRVTKAIRQAIADLKKHSPHLATHLSNQLDFGHLMRYRRTGIAWDLEPRNDS